MKKTATIIDRANLIFFRFIFSPLVSSSGINWKSPYTALMGWTRFPFMTVYLVKSGKPAGHCPIYDLKAKTVPDIKILTEDLWKTRKFYSQQKP
jgi:hypothetical protein